MADYSNEVRFALQPLYSLHTGDAIAVEALVRPVGCTTRQLMGRARKARRLVEVDVDLAARAIASESENPTLLPLHINLLALSAAAPPESLAPILDTLSRVGRRTRQIVIELGPPYTDAAPKEIVEGVARLRELGFQVAFDGLGSGDLPLSLLAATPVDMLKLDRSVLRMLPGNPAAESLVNALLHVAARTDARVVATGIDTEEVFKSTRELGLRLVQGDLFPATHLSGLAAPAIPSIGTFDPVTSGQQVEPAALSNIAAPTIADFIRQPVVMRADATCDDARHALADDGKPSALVGLDPEGRPRWTIDKSRFLLGISGRYGHALHANKPVERFADAPHTIPAYAGALDLLEQVADADADRMNDDIVVIDRTGACLGIVRVAEVIRGVAAAKIDEAASLNPLTGLPTSDTIAKDVEHRIAAGEPFIAACLDVDEFKSVNERVGFAAGDDLIRSLGRTLTELGGTLPRMTVSHVGGDDFLIAADMDEIGTLAPVLLDTPWQTEGVTVSVSLAGLVCAPGTVASYREVSSLLAGLKQRAKAISGTSWVLGRPGVERVDVLRGRLAQGAA
ncbi:MAG: EAL domain-containing protein [Actinophytocola sp.]|nr:EAL domain-containing protein [Actinophytocola sp.]